MEEDSFRINKKYFFAGLLLIAFIFGFWLNGIFTGAGKPARQSMTMDSSDSMASHHQKFMQQSSGFYNSAIGKQAPDFELKDADGNQIQLSDYRGKYVVLFFNEGGMCYPSCWKQISELTKDSRLNQNDIVSFSIVVDSQAQWQQIMKKVPEMENARILFDTSRKASADYDVLFTSSSMHKGSYPGHTYFVIDPEGIIRYTLDDPRMAINNEKIVENMKSIRGA